MKLLDIRNNLAKISYSTEEPIALGRFIAMVDAANSYVAQIINLKADDTGNFAIVKLLFTFNKEGIVDSYDGTIPSLNSELSHLNSKDILKLLPIEKSITIGKLAQQEDILRIDQSLFEQNLLICGEKLEHIYTIVNNSAAELRKNNEKIVVIDTDNTFSDLKSLKFGISFKLPLNYQMFDYLYENCLPDMNANSRAVIQEIIYDVQEYTTTLPNKFLPYDRFLNVVSAKYEETKIPELAVLAKLLRNQDTNIFAQNLEEIESIINEIKNNDLTYINVGNTSDTMQREVISYIFDAINSIDDYVYVFVKLNNHNSNKKLLKQLIDSEHIFTTIICSHCYKYVSELKQHAGNVILFRPQTYQHDFADYNTFLNKLNPDEFIVYGDHTQNIPFIVDLAELSQEELNQELVDENTNNIPTNEIPPFEPETEPVKQDDFEIMSDNLLADNNSDIENDTSFVQDFNEITENEFDEQFPDIENMPDNSNEEIQEYNIDISEQEVPDSEMFLDSTNETTYSTASEIQSFEKVEDNITTQQAEINLENSNTVSENYINNQIPNILEEESNNDNSFDKLNNEEISQSNNVDLDITQNADDSFGQEEQQAALPEFNSEDEELNDPYKDNNEELPVFPAEENNIISVDYKQGDAVSHPKYGNGIVEKLIKYGNKTLCSIAFDEVGKRLLDPAISELTKI